MIVLTRFSFFHEVMFVVSHPVMSQNPAKRLTRLILFCRGTHAPGMTLKPVAWGLNRMSDSFALPLSLASFVEKSVLLGHYYRPIEQTGAAARDLVLQPLQDEATGGTSEPTRPTRNGVNFHNRNEIGCPRQS